MKFWESNLVYKHIMDEKKMPMAHNKDYIPDRDAGFDGWPANPTGYVDSKVTAGAWTHISAGKVTALKLHNKARPVALSENRRSGP
jgi:hypothetical protein